MIYLGDIMKKIMIIMFIAIMLVGCKDIKEENKTVTSSTTTTITTTTTTTMTTSTTTSTTTSLEESLIGKYQEKTTDGSVPSDLELKAGNKFSITLNVCEGMATVTGTYKVNKDTLTLNFKAGQFQGFAGEDLTTLKFKINANKTLKFTSETVSCGPQKNHLYYRK